MFGITDSLQFNEVSTDADIIKNIIINNTSSSAVAKRPHDAVCLSVVSFNSTKRRAESFIVSYVGYRFITACN